MKFFVKNSSGFVELENLHDTVSYFKWKLGVIILTIILTPIFLLVNKLLSAIF